MNKKDITVGPRIINRTNWAEELIKAGYIDGSQHKALTTAQEMQLHRNKELECLKLLARFLTVENLKEVKMTRADLDSFIVEANWMSEFLTTKLKENQLDAALLPELLAVLPEFYHTVKTSSSQPVSELAMKSEFNFDKDYRGTEVSRKHYLGNTLLMDPETGRLISGWYTDPKTGVDKEFPLDKMKENYPNADWDRYDFKAQRQLAEKLRDIEYYLKDMEALGIKDVFPELTYDPVYLATVFSQPNVVYGTDIGKYIVYPQCNGELIHPRHYYYNKESEQIIWLAYNTLSNEDKGAVKALIKVTLGDAESVFQKLREAMTTPGVQVLNIDSLPNGDINHGIDPIRFDITNNRLLHGLGKTQRVVSTGMAMTRFSDMEGGGRVYYEQLKEQPLTIKGNSRQLIVDNGKHQWPAAKTRKGHRR